MKKVFSLLVLVLCFSCCLKIPASAACKPKALIVDYEGENSDRVGRCLREAGFKVCYIRSMKGVKRMNLKKYDCLVIPGGHNVTPSLYGAERARETYGTDIDKDRMQIKAIRKFAKAKKPILGVCRGNQIVNVALGGTIHQHLPKTGWHRGRRTIRFKKGSWLYPIFGKKESVHHYHHQCIKKLAPGLIATAWDDEDDLIEGFEHKTLPIYGVQWHPDCMQKKGGKVFRDFRKIVVSGRKAGGCKK